MTDYIKIDGKKYKVYRSEKKRQKFKIYYNRKWIHFGAKGFRIAKGTKKGDRYCARSSGIKSKGKVNPNKLSRKKWGCSGKKSLK